MVRQSLLIIDGGRKVFHQFLMQLDRAAQRRFRVAQVLAFEQRNAQIVVFPGQLRPIIGFERKRIRQLLVNCNGFLIGLFCEGTATDGREEQAEVVPTG